MNILVSGSSGLVGTALLPFLAGHSHRIVRLVRHAPGTGADEIFWNPASSSVDAASMEGMDAVVHLAGESIASGRWTHERKRRISDSRIGGTSLLSRTLQDLRRPPQVLISASAVGYYGDRGEEPLSEDSCGGSGFLADVCRRWEQAAASAANAGIRVVVLRLGMVLSPRGGALKKMLFPFRMGAGGRLGDGSQYVAWIALDDLLETILFLLSASALHGPVNAVAPGTLTNRDFTAVLSRVLRRPAMFPLPAFGIRVLFGEMGEQVLLSGARVIPARLTHAGFKFLYPDLTSALRHILA